MKILLLRHTESEKNIQNSFSSFDNLEMLTNNGEIQASSIAQAAFNYAQKNNFLVRKIYCADSERAKTTSTIIAKKFNVTIEPFSEFISVTTDKSIKGKCEQEIKEVNPQFMSELKLYRTGIFNAYNYSSVADVIKSGEYEKKIISTMQSILSQDKETLKIIVMHYSSLTAAMIYFARVGYNYPEAFYGKINSTLGNVFLIDFQNEKCYIELADDSPNLLSEIYY